MEGDSARLTTLQTLSSTGSLQLCFPQWQGSGTCRRLLQGCHVLRDSLEAPTDIATEPCCSLVREAGVDHLPSLLRQLQSCAATLAAAAPERLLLCGGDCATEVAPISYLNKLYGGQLNVVWLDAHADLNTPDSSPSHHLHGMPLRLLLGDGEAELLRTVVLPLRPQQVLLAGVRDVDPPERDFIETQGLVWLDVATLQKEPGAVAARLNPAWPTYVHLDLDVLDPKEFPHVCCPTLGGLGRQLLHEILAAISQSTVLVGAGITECTAQAQQEAEVAIDLLTFLKGAVGC